MSEKEKWVFIVNPTSGAGYGSKILPELQRRLEGQDIEAEIVLTEYHGHASEIASCFLGEGFTYFIAVGRRFAGSFFLTPGAIANDSLLDVCMIRKLIITRPKSSGSALSRKCPIMWTENSRLTQFSGWRCFLQQ